MSKERSTVAFLGFPSTGKSTYLGALWQLVQDPCERTVEERDLTGDRSYLQLLGDRVARCEEIGRTEASSVEGMELTLGFEYGDITVRIPDLGGEMLRHLVEDRTWPTPLLDTIAASDAMLLFIHPGNLTLPVPITMVDEVLSEHPSSPAIESAKLAKGQGANLDTGLDPPKFQAGSACTAAKCIDALENILAFKRTSWPIRLGIVISAWDTVEGSPTPKSWLNRNLPALDGFATANTDMIDWTLYGVSAQGGKLPTQRDKLLASGSVRKRVYARNASGGSVPVTDPLCWALTK